MMESPVKKAVSLYGGTVLGSGMPKICVPVVGDNADVFNNNLAAACSEVPDLIELRIDALSRRLSREALLSFLQNAVSIARKVCPVILTDRTTRDGGNGDPAVYPALISHLIDNGCETDLLDVEISAGEQDFARLLQAAKKHRIPVIASWHDFKGTPAAPVLAGIFDTMQTWHADVAKVAVMPQNAADVDCLINAAGAAGSRLSIPVIAISMGALGTRTRLECEYFGSCMTFASAGDASAPGQVSISAARNALLEFHNKINEKKG
ncbi:MAG: type I 3-dehydroquinate dehydratase [Clostridia bacterium]|nr:type I 3-dehydroquinate dehydratase [Clostridia bacterium]